MWVCCLVLVCVLFACMVGLLDCLFCLVFVVLLVLVFGCVFVYCMLHVCVLFVV